MIPVAVIVGMIVGVIVGVIVVVVVMMMNDLVVVPRLVAPKLLPAMTDLL